MGALNILSLIAGTTAQPQQGGSAPQEGATESGFAPVLNEQLQGAANAKADNAAVVSNFVSGFMQRLSVVVSQDAGQSALGQEGGHQGLSLQALVGRILDLLQQEDNAFLGQAFVLQAKEEGISIEMLTNLQPEQIESLATILNVPTADIKLALEKLIKQYLAEGAEFIVPVANSQSDFYTVVKKGEVKDQSAEVKQDTSAALVEVPLVLLNALPEEQVTTPVNQTSENLVLTQITAAIASAATKVNPDEENQKAQAQQAAEVSAATAVAVTANAVDIAAIASDLGAQEIEKEFSDLEEADQSEETDLEAKISEEAITQSGWLGIPIVTATLPQIASGFGRKIVDTLSAVTVLKTPEIKSGFQGASTERVQQAENPAVAGLALKETKGKSASSEAAANAAAPVEARSKAVSSDIGAIKSATERSQQAISKAEARIDLVRDERRANDDKGFAPNFVVDEPSFSREFSASESGVTKITDITQDIAGLKEAPAAAIRKNVERAPVFKPQPYQPVAEQVLVRIRDVASHDGKQIQISLDPKDLGKVDVRMDVGVDGRTQITMTIDKKETLEMLQRDRVSLEKALGELGMKTDSGGMSFNLREQPRGQQQLADQNQQQGGRGWIGEPLPEELREDVQPTQPYRSGYIVTVDEGVNISV